MAQFPLNLQRFASMVVLFVICLYARGDRESAVVAVAMPFPSAMPQTVLWAWEEPEDLRSAPESVGVAYLAETIFLGKPTLTAPAIAVIQRHQPLAVAPGAAVMAVVRVVALPGFQDSTPAREQTAAILTDVSHRSGLRALQIDFDATRSQRAFYAAVLGYLRSRMPAGMPLSITALLSWCAAGPGSGDWLSILPIDEAVPMFFRLGGNARSGDSKAGYQVREARCLGSRGISLDESWPPLNPRERIYVFAPRPWTPLELAAVASAPSGRRAPALQFDYAHSPGDTGLRVCAK